MANHKFFLQNSSNMLAIPDKSVELIITSPPYPMIEMWDEIFGQLNPRVKDYLEEGEGLEAFYAMHEILNQTWKECDRVLVDNGFICINIGDATRNINNNFQLYSNHTHIINYFEKLGYNILPDIHWRKQSNAPNKFMGSGMYPAGAYVTYEHEYILIFRKGKKREFKKDKRLIRQESAYFWEERNVWFSDLWEIKGTSQVIKVNNSSRKRNASFPFEIPYRLVNMYSIKGDTVLDPFSGLGTTLLACMALNRNSVGFEIDPNIYQLALENIDSTKDSLNKIIENRINNHINFINELPEKKREKCYKNLKHGFDVKTRQETLMKIDYIEQISKINNSYISSYY